MLLGDSGCRIEWIENPRVGGSISRLATSYIVKNDMDVECATSVPSYRARTPASIDVLLRVCPHD